MTKKKELGTSQDSLIKLVDTHKVLYMHETTENISRIDVKHINSPQFSNNYLNLINIEY